MPSHDSPARAPDASPLEPLVAWGARVPAFCRAHAGPVLAVAALLAVAMLPGLPAFLEPPDPADAVPAGTATARATDNVTSRFKSTFTQKATVVFQVDRDACLEDSRRMLPQRHGPDGEPSPEVDCGNITDEVYVRAMAGFFAHLRDHDGGLPNPDPAASAPTDRGDPAAAASGNGSGVYRYMVGLPSFLQLYNWTLAGGEDDAPPGAFSLPPPDDRSRWNLVHGSGWELLRESVTPTLNDDHTAAAVLFLVEPTSDASPSAMGANVLSARSAYVEAAGASDGYRVFDEDNPPLVAADAPVESAHTATLLREDLQSVLPLALAVVVAALALATGNARATLAGLAVLAGGLLATVGAAGHLGLTLHPFTLAVLPLVMALGLTTAVRVLLQPVPAPDEAAPRVVAAALMAAAAFTVAALGVLALGPSRLVAEGALLGLLGALVLGWAAVTVLPALVHVLGADDALGHGPDVLAPVVRGLVPVFRTRWIPGLALAGLVLAAAVGAPQLEAQPLRTTAGNWPADDPLAREQRTLAEAFHDLEPGEAGYATHIVTVEGDVVDPEAHAYVEEVTAALDARAAGTPVVDTSRTRNLPDIVRTWQQVRDGPESLATDPFRDALAQEGAPGASSYPESREEMEATLDALFASPMATFGSLFVDHPQGTITVVSVEVRQGGLDDARTAWDVVHAALGDAEDARPRDVHAAFVGTQPTVHLMATHQMPWLAGAGVAAGVALVLAGVLLVPGRRRRVAAAVPPALAAGVAAGLLPRVGIGVGVGTLVPLAGLAPVVAWGVLRARAGEDPAAPGPAGVLWSGLAFVGLAGVFAGIRYELVREAMASTALAAGAGLAVVFLVEALVRPGRETPRARGPPGGGSGGRGAEGER